MSTINTNGSLISVDDAAEFKSIQSVLAELSERISRLEGRTFDPAQTKSAQTRPADSQVLSNNVQVKRERDTESDSSTLQESGKRRRLADHSST